jgi:RES domain-containing protein
MEVFRIVKARYAATLQASGQPNRWNRKGDKVVYAGSSRALATLEQIVHAGTATLQEDFRVMVVSLPDTDNSYRRITSQELPTNWRTLDAYATLQRIGSDWARERETLILQVPSAVIPLESNWVVNTEHPDFEPHIRIVRVEDYYWDKRLLSFAERRSRTDGGARPAG